MILNKMIDGKFVRLRTAEESDAEFILQLRLNPKLNRFIHKTDSSLAAQKNWIKNKQEIQNDYYMIIESFNKESYGTLGVYDIDFQAERAEWGRWVIRTDAPFYVAVESCLLMYNFAFNNIGLKELYFNVRNQNKKVVDFHRNYGAHFLKKDECDIHFNFYKTDLPGLLMRYNKFHNVIY